MYKTFIKLSLIMWFPFLSFRIIPNKHLQGKKVHHKIHNVEPIIVPNPPKGILDRYNKVTLRCYLMHINGIGFLKTIYRHIIFDTGRMIKNRKVKNIRDGIK